MRIRKHAKVSPLVYAASSLKPGTVIQTHFCQLNQSPWDVLTFPLPDNSHPLPPPPPPPPPYQVDGGKSLMVNGNFSGYGKDNNSAPSIKFASNNDSPGQNEDIEWDKNRGKQTIGSKNSALCKKDIKGRVSFSEQVVKKRKYAKTVETRRPSRPRKPSSSSNPYGFYYYSGFGPSWGKNRGPATKEEAKCYRSESLKDEVVVMKINDDKSTPEINGVYSDLSLSERCNEGFDYVNDEKEEEEEKNEVLVANKKKARKLMKARSLKSLM